MGKNFQENGKFDFFLPSQTILKTCCMNKILLTELSSQATATSKKEAK